MVGKEGQIKNSFIYMLPMAAGALVPFVVIPILTRILSKEDFGVLALAQVYGVFVSGLAHFGMTTAYERNFFDFKDDLKGTAQLLYSCILFVFANFLLLSVLTWLFKDRFSGWIIGSPVHGRMLFWTFAGQFLSGLNVYFLTYYRNREIATRFTGYTIANVAAFHGLSVLFVAGFHWGVMGVVWAQLAAAVVLLTYQSLDFLKKFPPSLNRKVFVDAFKVAYPLTPRIFLGVISTQFDKYMIGLLSTLGAVGLYEIGQRVARGVFTFMTTIQNVFSPQVYQRMFDLGEAGGESIGRYLTPFAYLSIAAALGVAMLSEEIIHLLTPPEFHPASVIVNVLAVYYGFIFFGKVTGNQLVYKKKTIISSALTVLSVVVNVGFNIPLIMKWGAAGAAWATLSAGLVTQGVSFLIAQHYYRIHWEYGKIGAIYGVLLVSALALVMLQILGGGYTLRLGIKGAALATYVWLGIRFGVISLENYLAVKGVLMRKRAAGAS